MQADFRLHATRVHGHHGAALPRGTPPGPQTGVRIQKPT
jgi:hypothetical protein